MPTGQTGRQDRSSRVQAPDRSDRLVAPVISVLADQFCGFSRFASDLLRGFARSFEAFCVGLAFHSYSKLWSERLKACVIFGI